MHHRKLAPAALLLATLAPFAAAAAAPDPVLLYESCARQGIARIDASVEESWSSKARARLPRVLDAQNATVLCAEQAFPEASAAFAADAERRHALRFHFAKLKSVVELRMPEIATESQRQYRERIALDDAALAMLWYEVMPERQNAEESGSGSGTGDADLAGR